MSEEQYIYNIGAVERMTGIPAATLRAWERRYDFPQSERSEGKHRLYSDRHIMSLRWIKNKIDQGVQTKQAILMFRQRETEGNLNDILAVQAPALAANAAMPSERLHLDQLTQRLIAVLLVGDLAQADDLFARELALYSPESIISEVILPTFVEMGRRWEEGVLGISNEHLATQYLRHRLVMWLHTGPPTYAVPPVVLACAPGELHEGSLLILGTLLRRRRWPISYLGQSVPLDDLARFVREISPVAVVLVAMREEAAQALVHWPTAMPDVAEQGQPLVGFGGRIFVEQPAWRARVPGVYLGDDLRSGVDVLERHLRTRSPALIV
ncbi:MAG: MerR family transcriptional regulator [Anaerolineae bacterium]|nr:MerR family transcriptional regulator [Anaerolineae bacterium]